MLCRRLHTTVPTPPYDSSDASASPPVEMLFEHEIWSALRTEGESAWSWLPRVGPASPLWPIDDRLLATQRHIQKISSHRQHGKGLVQLTSRICTTGPPPVDYASSIDESWTSIFDPAAQNPSKTVVQILSVVPARTRRAIDTSPPYLRAARACVAERAARVGRLL
jgi:hypothetical protein